MVALHNHCRFLLWLVTLSALLCVGGCADMDSFLFNTETISEYHPPAGLDSLLESFTVTSDGYPLYGYRVRSNAQGRRMTLLYCHGNKHNMDAYWDRIEFLSRLGIDVVTFDYRGFGRSEGTSTESGLTADARAVLDWVRGQGVPDDSIVVCGFSLGCYPALYLAGRAIAPRVVIVESPFASATSLVQGGAVIPFREGWLTEGRFDNIEAVRMVRSPILVLHGANDDFVRYRDNGRLVYDAAPEPKLLRLVDGAGHDNVPQTMGVDRYVELLRMWIGLN